MCQTKNEARNKLYKKGHIHILPSLNILVVIVEKLLPKCHWPETLNFFKQSAVFFITEYGKTLQKGSSH